MNAPVGGLEARLASLQRKLRERERAIVEWLPAAQVRGEQFRREHPHLRERDSPVFFMKVGQGGGPPAHVRVAPERLLAEYCGINPPLAASDLAAFEGRRGVVLPEEYRAFLQRVGNGGVGPYYGLRSLAQSAEALAPWLAEDAAYLARPFPLVERLSLRDEYRRQTGRDAFEDWSADGNDPAAQARVQAFFAAYEPDRYRCGVLFICHYGCGIECSLVVSGAERGKVWVDDFTNDSGVFPVRRRARPDQHLSFLDWYETWLDADLHRWRSADGGDVETEDPFVWFE